MAASGTRCSVIAFLEPRGYLPPCENTVRRGVVRLALDKKKRHALFPPTTCEQRLNDVGLTHPIADVLFPVHAELPSIVDKQPGEKGRDCTPSIGRGGGGWVTPDTRRWNHQRRARARRRPDPHRAP